MNLGSSDESVWVDRKIGSDEHQSNPIAMTHSHPNQTPNTRQAKEPIPDHPLAKVAGTVEGEAWEATLAAIRRAREEDREYLASLTDEELQ